jgi:hypothetical protein
MRIYISIRHQPLEILKKTWAGHQAKGAMATMCPVICTMDTTT